MSFDIQTIKKGPVFSIHWINFTQQSNLFGSPCETFYIIVKYFMVTLLLAFIGGKTILIVFAKYTIIIVSSYSENDKAIFKIFVQFLLRFRQ